MTDLSQHQVVWRLPRDEGTARECYNIPHLTAIADWLESHSVAFSMLSWSSTKMTYDVLADRAEQGHVCGTSACMVGWAPYALPVHFRQFLTEVRENGRIHDIHCKGFYRSYADRLLIDPKIQGYKQTVFANALYTSYWDESGIEYKGRSMLLSSLACELVNEKLRPNIFVPIEDCSRLAAVWRCRYVIDDNFLDIPCQQYLDMVVPFIVQKTLEIHNVV